jgi:FkbM family methyltransferase
MFAASIVNLDFVQNWTRYWPGPTQDESLMTDNYFSQNGEDFLLSRYFSGNTGFFVEVGCIDGRRFSNTYHFELRGWKGLCVEAHQGYISLLKANRPNSIVVPCAVGEADEEEIVFYANARGSLSSLDPATEERWKREYPEYFSGFEQQKVAKRTLTTLFEEHKVPQIDFLSLDIEGYEVQALQGLDFRRHRPSVLVVESDSPGHRQKIDELLSAQGYRLALDFRGNLYYSVLPDFKNAVADRLYPNVLLTHTQHPLDKTGDEQRIVSIDTRQTPVEAKGAATGFHSRVRNFFAGGIGKQ